MREIFGVIMMLAVPIFLVLCYKENSVTTDTPTPAWKRYSFTIFLLLVTCMWVFLLAPGFFRIFGSRGETLVRSFPVAFFWGTICSALLLSFSLHGRSRKYALLALLSLVVILEASILV